MLKRRHVRWVPRVTSLPSSKERKKDATAGKGSSMKNGQHGCMCLHLSGKRNGWSIRVTDGAGKANWGHENHTKRFSFHPEKYVFCLPSKQILSSANIPISTCLDRTLPSSSLLTQTGSTLFLTSYIYTFTKCTGCFATY